MKQLLTTILLLSLFLSTKAQTITCHDSAYQTPYESICHSYDTSIIKIKHVSYDTSYTTRCGYLCRKGIKPAVTKINRIDSTVTFTYDTSISENSFICVKYKDTIVSVCDTVYETLFGAKIQDGSSDDQITVLNELGTVYARATSVDLSAFNGKSQRLDDFFAAGIKSVVNLNNINSSSPVAFPTDLSAYESRLRKFLDIYSSKIFIAVIENEPTNKNYYSGSMQDYLNELTVAVKVCHEYGVKVADGCTHIEYIMLLITPVKNPPANVADVQALIAGYKSIPLDYVNLHTNGSGDSYPKGQIKAAVDYIQSQTGHKAMSNEWHLDNATDNLVNDMVGQWKDAKVYISIIWGGGGSSPADAINTGTTLTAVGQAYRDAIK